LVPLFESLTVETGKRILIHAPPQFGKSIIVSKRFPAWALGRNPLLRIILAGYNYGHAAGFCEVVREIVAEQEFKEAFPDPACQLIGRGSRTRFSTAARAALKDGHYSLTAVGLLSGFTGKGADILIIDDPYASPDDARSKKINERVWRWWNELAMVRINDQTNVIVMFHRYHEDDFAGRLLAEGGWEYLRFPAIADENEDGSDPTGRKPGELLSPMRSARLLSSIEEHDPMVWLGQFQGRPRAAQGAFIKREWLHEIAPSTIPPLSLWVRFWDLATKANQRSDYYSGALLGIGPDQMLYLRDVTRFRAEWPDAREIIAETTRRDYLLCDEAGAKYEVGVEKVVWMHAMIQDMNTLPVFKYVSLTPVAPSGDKKERASGWVAKARNGLFTMVKDHWNSDFINECLSFDGTGTVHDDQVDSVSGAYHLIWDVKGGVVEEKREPEVGSILYYRQLAAERRRQEQDDCWNADWYSEEDD
jgi:predicted phage terminase large subunit-like protein